jgi:hypothetical protein
MAITNQQIIEAYQQTGSVWKAGKLIGLSGQSVHERLTKIGYKLSDSMWTDEEYEELKSLVGHFTIAEIANKLARPYAGVALKISRLGLSNQYANKQMQKVPKNGQFTKPNVSKYIKEIDESKATLSQYAIKNNLHKQSLNTAIQKHFPEWYSSYCEKNGTGIKIKCPECQEDFWQMTKRHFFCSGTCSNRYRIDQDYFGGKRKQTIGLAEQICQICKRHVTKGLSSHHIIGKENDPDNLNLIALCQGCHKLVTQTAGRNFVGDTDCWESLIVLSLLRKHGFKDEFKNLGVTVDIQYNEDDEE